MSIVKYYDFKDFEIFIFNEFVINQIKEGVAIETHHNDQLNEIIKEHFSGKCMVYISNRQRSYSVNPLIYPETKAIPNLLAIAMVPRTDTMKNNAEYERQFYMKPYELFDCLADAIHWAVSIIKKNAD